MFLTLDSVDRHSGLSLPDASRLRLVQDEHFEIVAAIEARDGARARAAMERHIDNVRRRMFEGAPATT
jgi:GntR family transcriptional repressor for pyruvate dehydrogenase complex